MRAYQPESLVASDVGAGCNREQTRAQKENAEVVKSRG